MGQWNFPPKRDVKMLALAEGMQWAESTGAHDAVLEWTRSQGVGELPGQLGCAQAASIFQVGPDQRL